MSEALKDGVLTFLLTDIEGSTNLWESLPGQMRQAVRRHDQIMRRVMGSCGGHVFRTAGDSFHGVFALPAQALAAAVAAQRDLAKEDFSGVGSLRVRMAIHTGPVESRDGDYYGQGINQAARILAVTHGGQVLVSGTAERVTGNELPPGAQLLDLGYHYLRDFQSPERLLQVAAADLRLDFPALRSGGRPPNNVVAGTTTFVGRAEELADIESAFDHARLVTLLGNGGAGKTRLSIESALRLMPRFPDGVWFVDFSTLENPSLVADKTAAVIGAASSSEQASAESISRTLRNKTALLIFDNCEHILAATADLANYVLALCPTVAILATSRQPLAIPAEHVIPIRNLDVGHGDILDAEAILASPAIRLFVDRAKAAAGFTLTSAHARSVVDICRRLDGIPLAIELAAPQLRTVKLDTLAALLRDSFGVQSRMRTTPARHRTLASTFDWSYRLLGRQEQLLLQRLGVFASGCGALGAAEVCGFGELAGVDVGTLLPDLVDKSLVVADLTGPETRFRLLETTRRYALDKLAAGGHEAEARKRLAIHVTNTLTEATRIWPTLATATWKERYGPELDNARACLEWVFGPEGDPERAVTLVSVTLRLWDEYGLLPERQKWFGKALAAAPPSLAPEILGRLFMGNTSLKGAADPLAFGMAAKAIDLLRTRPVSLELGEAVAKAGSSLLLPNNVAAARPYLTEAREILLQFGPTKQLASCLRSLGAMSAFERDFSEARRFTMEAESICRKIGDIIGVETNRINMAETDFASGDSATAIASAREILRRGAAGPRLLALCESNLSIYLICTNDLIGGEASAIKALKECRALAWAAQSAIAIGNLALIKALNGDCVTAAQLLGFIESRFPDWHESREPVERVLLDRLMQRLTTSLSPDRLALLRRIGAGCSDDEACELAIGAVTARHPLSIAAELSG